MDFSTLASAFATTFTLHGLFFLCVGVAIGLLFGVMPGLGGPTALALLIPVTYSLEPFDAMLLAGGVMGAVSFGGSITAILLNTPGTAPNAATCFDGYPMAQQGRAGAALGASAAASALGGALGLITLLAVLPLAKVIVLSFGPAEFLMLALVGLAAVAMAARGKLLRGLVAAAFGLLLSFIGFDSVTGEVRFSGGLDYLWDGIELVPALVGIFALAQMFELGVKGVSVAKDDPDTPLDRVMSGVYACFKYWKTLLRGSVVGTLIGAVPGLGGTVASFLAYTATVQTSKDPDSFGRGNIEGVIAPEAANNARDGGSLIPTLAFGIPGGAETAVFLSILVLHGMTPGPAMLINNEHEIYGLIVAITISAILASVVGLALARWLRLVTKIDVRILVPIVAVVSLTGVYVLRNDFGDVIVCLLMGVVGYLMMRFDYSRLTLVTALVLGDILERSFHQTQMIYDGDMSAMFGRLPVQLLSLVLLVIVGLPFWRWFRQTQKARREVSSDAAS